MDDLTEIKKRLATIESLLQRQSLNHTQPKTETIKSTPLKNARELAAMLKQLPKEERLRLEGIIIGISIRPDAMGKPSA